MYGLQAIILNDSYYPGLRTRIDCGEHTNNTGENGAGKTSALLLIPIFYGQDPIKLVDRTGNKLSFLDYYLPRPQSMVVFEYERESGTCCVVLYRKSGDSLAYRIIQGSADDTIFAASLVEKHQDGIESRVLLRQVLPQQGVVVSNQIDTTRDYRAVIQNNRRELNRRGNRNRRLVNDATRFSLGSAASHMKHIEALTSVVLKHDRLLEQFKVMIVDSFLQDQLSVASLPYNRKDQSLIQDMMRLDSFRKEEKRYRQLVSEYRALKQRWQFLLTACPVLEDKRIEHEKHLAELEEVISCEQESLNDEEEQYLAKRKEIVAKIQDTETQFESVKTAIDTLCRERDNWETQNIIEQIQQVDAIPLLEKQFKKNKSHYDFLFAGMSDERAQFLEKKSDIEQQCQLDIDALNYQSENALKLFEEARQIHDEQLESLQQVYEKRENTVRDERGEAEEVLRTEREEASVSLQMARQLTGSEYKELSAVEKDRDQAQAILNSLNGELNSFRDKENELRRTHDDCLQQYQNATKVLNRLRDEEKQLQQTRFPQDGTLLAFLKENGDEWRKKVGKVLHPQLYLRRDLAPTVVSNDDTLFGITMELDELPLPEEAQTDQYLEERIERVKNKLCSQKQTVQTSEIKVTQAEKEKKAHDEVIMQCQLSISHQQAVIERVLARLEDMKRRHQEAAEQRHMYAKQQFDQANKFVEDAKIETERLLKQIHSERDQRRFQLRSDWSLRDAEEQERKQNVSSREKQIKEARDEQIAELQKAFERACEAKGIDQQTLNVARQRWLDAKAALEQAEQLVVNVTKYQRWHNEECSRLGRLTERESELKHAVSELRETIKKLKRAHDVRAGEIRKRMQSAQLEQQENDKQRQILAGLVNAITSITETLPAGVSTDPVELPQSVLTLIDEVNDTRKFVERKRELLKESTREVIALLDSTHADSQIGRWWQEAYAQHKTTSTHMPGMVNFVLEAIDDIATLLEIGIPQIEKSILVSLEASGGQLAEYYQTLSLLNSKVVNISSTLKKRLNTYHTFPAISDIEVQLKSKVSEFDIWPLLKAFDQNWITWCEAGRGELPDSDFISTLSQLADAMSRTRIDNSFYSLVDLTISLKENGRIVPIRTDADLRGASSTGISLLAVIVVFCGMTRYLCPDNTIRIHWPLDEIGRLSGANIGRLFELMGHYNIALFCAQPDPSPSLSRHFVIKNELDRQVGVRRYRPHIGKRQDNPLLEASVSKREEEVQL